MQDTGEDIRLGGEWSLANQMQTCTHAAKRRPGRGKEGYRGSGGGRAGERSHGDPDGRPRMSREITLEIAAREYVWLWDHRHGISVEAIAAREDVSTGRVRFGVARARAQERSTATTSAIRPPRLVPLFPIGAYTPGSNCAHRRPIEQGSALCCMVCHTSGMDRHPALRRDPQTDPVPEPKAPAAPEKSRRKRETRKQRRKRLFGASS